MNVPRQWAQDRFFKGFLATMVLNGATVIETQEQRHQARFDRVARRYQDLRSSLEPQAVASFPKYFGRSPITGSYKDFDDALISLQNGLMGAQNPYYVSVGISCSDWLAKNIVEDYSPAEKQVLAVLVSTYLADDDMVETPDPQLETK